MPDADLFGTPPSPDDQASGPIDDAGTTGISDEAAGAAPLPIDADEVLLAAVDVARTALLDITPAHTIGAPVGHIVEGEHVLSLLFECTMAGYPGWRWTVSMSRIDESSEPFVLETELMPGETALLAPEWVPWSERLADYRTAQDAAAALALADAISSDDDDVDDLEDEDDDEEDDDDEDDVDDDDEDDDEDEDDDDEDEEDDELEETDLVDDEFADDLTELIDEDIESFDGDGDDEGDERLNGAESGQESTSPEVDPGKASDAEGDSDDGAPEPPAPAGGDQVVVDDDKNDERH